MGGQNTGFALDSKENDQFLSSYRDQVKGTIAMATLANQNGTNQESRV